MVTHCWLLLLTFYISFVSSFPAAFENDTSLLLTPPLPPCGQEASSITARDDVLSGPPCPQRIVRRVHRWYVNIRNYGTRKAVWSWRSGALDLSPGSYYVLSYIFNKDIQSSIIHYRVKAPADVPYEWHTTQQAQHGANGTHTFKMPEGNPVYLECRMPVSLVGINLVGSVALWQIGP